jgi:hypothetical protein
LTKDIAGTIRPTQPSVGAFEAKMPNAISDILKDVGANVMIYPNPVVDVFSLKNVDYADIIISNISGTIVKKVDYLKDSKIDVRNLAKGIYLVNVHEGKAIFKLKLFKR